jgi:protein gp37
MSGESSIEWTDVTWNPVTGCDRVSPGCLCAHCYALDLAARLKGMGQKRYQRDGDPKTSGPGFGLTLHPDKLEEPLRWRKPRMVFVNSMSDLFHEEIPDEYIDQVFEVMENSVGHIFQVLTKRPERMLAYVERRTRCGACNSTGEDMAGFGCGECNGPVGVAPEEGIHAVHPRIWLGVSIENRRFVHRADLLRQTPAAVRFISAEPLLGPLFNRPRPGCPTPGQWGPNLDLTDIDWLIAGGESGPKARPMRVEWVRSVLDACLRTREGWSEWSDPDAAPAPPPPATTGTAFFFKQWGGRTPKAGGRELDGRTWDEFPAAALPAATEAA